MSILSRVKKGVQHRAQRVIIYGPEGVGKSTLAAGFPSPILLDTEQGSSHLDVARLDCREYGDVLNALDELLQGGHDFNTVIIDSIDWTERLLTADFLAKLNKRGNTQLRSIEDIGYGKGYKMIEPVAMNLLSKLNQLMTSGLNIVLVGHSRRVKFEMPETVGAYDKHELNLSKYVAPLVKEWADVMLFCNFLITVQDGKGQGGSQRVVYTSPAAPWEAKNRQGMPAMMDMNPAEICSYLFPGNQDPRKLKLAEKMVVGDLSLGDVFDVIHDKAGAIKFLVHRGQISEGQTLADVSADYMARILANPDRFNASVQSFISGL